MVEDHCQIRSSLPKERIPNTNRKKTIKMLFIVMAFLILHGTNGIPFSDSIIFPSGIQICMMYNITIPVLIKIQPMDQKLSQMQTVNQTLIQILAFPSLLTRSSNQLLIICPFFAQDSVVQQHLQSLPRFAPDLLHLSDTSMTARDSTIVPGVQPISKHVL